MGGLSYRIGVPEVAADSAPQPAQALYLEQNDLRAAAGVFALRWSRLLAGVAADRVQDMLARGYFDHRTPEGTWGYVDTLARRGVLTYSWAGENLALDGVRTGINAGAIAFENFDASPGHHANMVDPAFDTCGIAYARTGDGRDLFCVIFVGGFGGFAPGDSDQ